MCIDKNCEFKWNQVKPSEAEKSQLSKVTRRQVKLSEFTWNQVKSS